MSSFRENQVQLGSSSLHVVEAGDPDAPALLFLHGWPESAHSWAAVQRLAAAEFRAVAFDLPGIGGSTGAATDGSKAALARVVHEVIRALALRDVVLVGQDVGGMIAYSYLREFGDLRKAVIMDVVVPGLDPWERVVRNPYIWHFGMHAVPELPERLVQGRQRDYFGYFFDILSVDGATAIPAESREIYARAYASDAALTAGFNWYRTFPLDAERNAAMTPPVTTPLLYLRGDTTSGQLGDYVDGLRAAGIQHVEAALIPDAGHYAQEEAPDATWKLIADFARS
ncbi:alpha/beta fold hydrolase [Amycolatopsis anabasis]|uniref:alpha/beta fold hydrolase n=1 Tax=Amycolatopsis anabasis TaxID=1840409 RepID=UPI00131BBBC7|nr:alpha/beta hydrolase [Amycolatopsis anabasis]